ncbi:putative glycerol uptake facilitator protein [Gammaproteobacteria bacterium]
MQNYFIGELLGTMTLILLGCGGVANVLLKKCKGENGGWICITAGWAFAVILGVFVAQAAGSAQADINPAVTVSKYCLHIYTCFTQVILQIIAQLIGAFVGAVIVWLAYLPHWKETSDKVHKLGVFATSPAILDLRSNFLCEIIGTFVLVLGIGALVTNTTIIGGLTPYFVGLLVWSIGLSLGGPTGYAINPARDLGPRLAHAILPIPDKGSSDWNYAWVPIAGPIVGSLIGVLVWGFVFIK